VLLREFILGNNRTGLFVEGSKDSIGPDHSKLVAGAAGNVVRADAVVYMGAGMTQSTFVFPSATVAAWDGFMATRWASKHPASSSVVTPTPTFGVLLSLLSAVLFAGWVL
jgi:carboxypeptidase D